MQAARHQTGERQHTSPETVRDWLTGQGTEGAVLLSLAERAQRGHLAWGRDVWHLHDKIHIRFPEALAGLGMDAATLRTGLEAKGWTERDLNTPSRATVMLPLPGGERAVTLRFNTAISRGLLRLLPEPTGVAPPATTTLTEPVKRPAKRTPKAPRIKSAPKHPSPDTPKDVQQQLPLGPFLPAAVVARLADPSAANPQDSSLIRPCFHSFVLQRLAASERTPSTLTDTEIRRAITGFARQHQTITAPWLTFHLTRGRNSWAIRAHAGKQQALAFNPQYRPELDEPPETSP